MQTTQAAAVVLEIPDRVHEAVREAGASIWAAAQDVASEHLAAAQQKWDQERLEAETMRKELADAYDAAQMELEDLGKQIEEMRAAVNQVAAEHVEEVRRLEDARHKMEVRAERAEQDAQHQHAAAERLTAEQDELREKLSTATERGARAAQRVADLSEELDRERTRFDALIQRLEGAPWPRPGEASQ